MLDPDKALELIRTITLNPETQTVPVAEACGRVLAEKVRARIDSPPFSKAAMDGFAVQGSDGSEKLRIMDTIAAGQVPHRRIDRGQCCRIMTGAMLPAGAERVIRVEFTEERDGWITVVQPETSDNVIRRGENLRAGQGLLEAKVLRPQDIGVLASQGIEAVRVAVSPLTGVITTGSELRSAGEKLEAGQIYNSNGPQLCAQLAEMNARCRYYGMVDDDPQKLSGILASALAECDLVLLSGGVSMGELDFVPEVLERQGARVHFHRLAIKPGKPTLFAQKGGKFIFGLPGNPVSTFIIFEVFVKMFLYRWMGLEYSPRTVRAALAETVRRRDSERLEYRPVRLEGNRVLPLDYHGSSHLSALRQAEGLIRIERGVSELTEGMEIDVRLL
jgi:molybdopterin molybdotransferase